MSMGFTYYKCQCGGEIREEWSSVHVESKCDSCDNPEPCDEIKEEFKELRDALNTHISEYEKVPFDNSLYVTENSPLSFGDGDKYD